MAEQDEGKALSEDQQMALALDWYIAMWDEAINRGVAEQAMGMISLSATTSKLVKCFGRNAAVALLERTRDNINDGQFDFEEEK